MHTKQLLRLGLIEESPTQSSDYDYTTQPTDDIDVIRLLEGDEAFFRQPAIAREFKKKHIIITDPRVAYGLSPPPHAELQIWLELLGQGFPISIWNGNELVRVQHAEELLPAMQSVEAIRHEDLTQYLTQHGIDSNECYLAGVGHAIQLCAVTKIADQHYLELTHFLNLSPDQLAQFFACVPDVPTIFTRINNLTWDKMRANPAFISFLQKHPAINLGPTDLTLGEFHHQLTEMLAGKTSLKSVELYRDQDTAPELSDFVKSNPTLEKLILYTVSAIPSTTSLPPRLKSLHFLFPEQLSWEQVQDFVTASKELEELTVCHYELPNLPKPLSFPATLRKLYIHGSGISWDQLALSTQSCPQLENLNLSHCAFLGTLPKTTFLPKTIRELSITSSRIDRETLNHLLQSLPLLESLELEVGKELWNNPEELPIHKNLKRLKFYSGHTPDKEINWETLAKILNHFNNVEYLDLSYCRVLNKLPKDLSCLSHIKYINVSHSDVSKADLARLKQFNPNLTIYNQEENAPKLSYGDTPPPLDNNTGPNQADLVAQQVFENIPPNIHRQKIHFQVGMNEQIVMPIKLEEKLRPAQLEKATEGAKTHIGHITLQSDKWIPLPGLTPDDKLIKIESIPTAEIEINYCDETSQYFIKPKNSLKEAVTLSFTIEADIEKNKAIIEPVDESLLALVEQLRFLPPNTLETNDAFRELYKLSDERKMQVLLAYFQPERWSLRESEPVTGCHLLNAIIKNRVGACRHRTIAFLVLASVFQLPARAVFNDVHAFVEVKQKGKWRGADLGGAPANILVKPPPKPKKQIKPLRELPTAKSEPPPLDSKNPLRTWDTVSIDATSMSDYVEKLLHHTDQLENGKKNALCMLTSQQIPHFYTALLKTKKNRCFYLPNLNAIKMKQTVIKNEDGSLNQQDSQLKQFLDQAKPGDVLAVDWSEYQAEHIGYNSMTDPERRIRGMPIPEGVSIIAVNDRQQTMGEDFFSRFGIVSDCNPSLSGESLIPKPSEKKAAREIRFYDDAWRSTLEGKITTDGGHYHIASSSFLDAILAGEKSVTLRNAPWDLPAFQLFITELLSKRQMTINGKTHPISADFEILRDDSPYELNQSIYKAEAYTKTTSLNQCYALNSMTFNSLFSGFKAENKQLKTLDGLIKTHENKTLSLFVSETLSENKWARILYEAEENHTKLQIIVGPGARLPFAPSITTTERVISPSQLIETNDIDLCAALQASDAFVLPVNEKTTYADLTGTHKIKKLDDGVLCDFEIGSLTKALREGKKVILKGKLSPQLAQQLSSVYLTPPYLQVNGERIDDIKGELCIISNANPGISFVSSEKKIFSEEEKWSALAKRDPANVGILKKACDEFYQTTRQPPFQYIQLKSMLEHLQNHPRSNPLKSILRAKKDYMILKEKAELAWKNASATTKIKSKLPTKLKRHKKISNRLKNKLYLFINGPSGVGKTTTAHQVLRDLGYDVVDVPGTLNDKLRALFEPGNKKALVLDEINLFDEGELDALEGLDEIPPTIMVDGVLRNFPPDARIVMLGNFGNLKGRNELRFITRHGNVMSFKEFDDEYLIQDIMQPVCDELKLNKIAAEEIIRLALQAYHHINDLYHDKHPLTARNLLMMIMRYAVSKNLHLSVYDEIAGVLDKNERKQAADWMMQQHHVDIRKLKKEAKAQTKTDFMKTPITKKRINPIRVLNDFMKLRQARIDHPKLANKGTSGLFIEGMPGIGKSFLLIEYLRAQGFVDATKFTREEAENETGSPNKRFYWIQSGDMNEIRPILIRALHEGAGIVIDEINTLQIEHELNAILSGQTPEGVPAKHPGAFVWGTGNPKHFAKRQALSGALSNRFQKLDLKEDDYDGLLSIVKFMQGKNDKAASSDQSAEKLVDYYFEAKRYADYHHKKPQPTPRDLFKRATKI
jgi:hypothetical protein